MKHKAIKAYLANSYLNLATTHTFSVKYSAELPNLYTWKKRNEISDEPLH